MEVEGGGKRAPYTRALVTMGRPHSITEREEGMMERERDMDRGRMLLRVSVCERVRVCVGKELMYYQQNKYCLRCPW